MGLVMGLAGGGGLELVECFLYLYWNGDVHYAGIVVLVKCDATVETPCPILCYFIFFLEGIY